MNSKLTFYYKSFCVQRFVENPFPKLAGMDCIRRVFQCKEMLDARKHYIGFLLRNMENMVFPNLPATTLRAHAPKTFLPYQCLNNTSSPECFFRFKCFEYNLYHVRDNTPCVFAWYDMMLINRQIGPQSNTGAVHDTRSFAKASVHKYKYGTVRY